MNEDRDNIAWPERLGEIRAAAYLVLREAVVSFFRNRNLENAATMAYYGSLALMPLLLLVIFMLGLVMHSSEAVLEAVSRLMRQIFPSFSEAILGDLMRLSKDRTWGIVSLIVLLWSVTPFAGALRNALNAIFRAESRLNVVLAKLLDLAAVLALLLLFVVLAGSRMIFSGALRHMIDMLLPYFEMARSVLTFALTLLILGFFYRVFSSVRLRWSHLLAGALTTTLLMWIIRPLFGWVLRFNPDYGYVFGSLKAIFLLIIWVYYTFAVVLFGAEVIAAVRRRNSLLLGRLLLGASPLKRSALRLMARFVRTLSQGEILFEEGSSGREMFYVLSGQIAIVKKGRTIKVLKPGEYFGEMSMLLNAPRTASAVIRAPETQVVAISEEYFDSIMHDNPEIVRRILVEMARRLSATNEQLSVG